MANGHGGARVGAGRKPKPKPGVVLGMDGARISSTAPPAASESKATSSETPDAPDLLAPPPDLKDPVARQCWKRFAPLAITGRTLTPETMPGFRQLCQQWSYAESLDAMIQLLGAASADAEEKMKTWLKVSQRLDASLARFKLTAFGKPAVAEKPKASANPFAAIGKAGGQ